MENESLQNILLVSQSYSYILSSLTQYLEEKGYNVIRVKAQMSEMNSIKDTIHCVLLYTDEDFEIDMQILVYIKDKAIEEEIPVFLIGDDGQIANAREVIPNYVIRKEFMRPVNVKEVAADVDRYLKDMGSRKRKKVLVVDDSGAVLRNVKGWLEDKYQIALANSGAMAIKYLAMDKPDLILLDYEMPVCDGKQVLQMIRSEMEFSTIPVIFLTSKNDKESVMSVSALKPDGYLLKTLEPAQIVRAVDEFFEINKARIK